MRLAATWSALLAAQAFVALHMYCCISACSWSACHARRCWGCTPGSMTGSSYARQWLCLCCWWWGAAAGSRQLSMRASGCLRARNGGGWSAARTCCQGRGWLVRNTRLPKSATQPCHYSAAQDAFGTCYMHVWFLPVPSRAARPCREKLPTAGAGEINCWRPTSHSAPRTLHRCGTASLATG